MFFYCRRAAPWVAACIGALLAVAPAFAETPSEGEKQLKQGIRQYDEGKFDASLRTLEQAAKAAASDAKLLGRIHLYRGVVYAVTGKVDKAKEAFGAAIRHDPTVELEPDQFKQSVVDLFRAAQGTATAYLTVRSQPPNAEVIIRGRTIGRTPVQRHAVPAGETFVVVRLGGKELVRRVELRPGQEEVVRMELAGAAPTPPGGPAPATTASRTPASAPSAAAPEPVGPSLLRPGTRRGYLSFGLGGGFPLNDNISAFQLAEELGFHFRRSSSGPGLALVAAQAFGSVDTYMDPCGAIVGTVYRVDAALKFFWDIQVSSRLGIYISPFLQAGYVYNHVAPSADYSSIDSFTSHGGTVNVGSDVKLLIGDRGLLFVRPFGILVTVTDSLTKNEGGSTYTCEGQRTAVHYQLLVGGGVTF